jgi:N-formylglutamate amidohydrolase
MYDGHGNTLNVLIFIQRVSDFGRLPCTTNVDNQSLMEFEPTLITELPVRSPVVISVPHAGRDYPSALPTLTRFSSDDLIALEDRLVDILVEPLAGQAHQVIVARTPRVWIDLNRDENDYDPAMLHPPQRMARPLSAKARGGLGLIPRRTAGLGDIWHSPISLMALEHRIATVHRPYHRAIAAAMDRAVAQFGAAVLIDLHSMPPLPRSGAAPSPNLVIGDRFGRSCSGRLSAHTARLANALGLISAFNVPYAGGFILDRHGQPARQRHAIQIEIDRSLYLDASLRSPGPGVERMQEFVAALAAKLADEIKLPRTAIAAE